MAFRSATFATTFLLILAVLTAGCGSTDSSRVNVVAIGNPDDPFESGVRLSLGGQLARAAIAEGLVAFDDEGRVIPALADRWTVTDDGRSYIFRLRDGTWRDGKELTARTASRALQASIRALRGTSLGLDLSGVEEVREMAGRVVEIRLSRPMPHLLQLLAQPELGLLNGGEGAGPMQLVRDGDIAMLTPIAPEELGLPAIADWPDRVRTIGLSAMDGKEAVRLFNAGEVDLVLGGRIVNFPETASVGILRGTIQLDPVEGLFGLRVASGKGFLADPANREALALAIDREALIAPFGVSGWTARASLVPLGTDRDPPASDPVDRWQGEAMEERRARATAQVARWRADQDDGEDAVKLVLALPQGSGSDNLFERLKQDFAAIGVDVSRAGENEGGDLRLFDVVARYPQATWFLNRFNCDAGKDVCSPEADAALSAARKSQDPAERAALIADAERILTEANVFIPFGSPIRWSLVRGDALGFAANRWGWHPLMPMALLPK